MTMKKAEPGEVACREVYLREDQMLSAARRAIEIFPPNASFNEIDPKKIAVQTGKFWGARVRDMTFGFMDRVSQGFIDQFNAVANNWGGFSAARWRYTADPTQALHRIAFENTGYWSYVGTDVLGIPASEPTMNLQGFTTRTPASEWLRVVQHECGHGLGCPHEQARRAVLDLLDSEKTIAYFMRTQGWGRQDVIAQILTPIEERSLMTGGSAADVHSIMCYQFPASVTRSGQPIPGGLDFSAMDREYFAKIYPPDQAPLPPPPPGAGAWHYTLSIDRATGKPSVTQVI